MFAILILGASAAAWSPPPDNSTRFGAPAATCAAAFPKDAHRRASCGRVRQLRPDVYRGDVCAMLFSEAKALGFVLDHARYSIHGHEGRCDFE
jgi:hypothetical protein